MAWLDALLGRSLSTRSGVVRRSTSPSCVVRDRTPLLQQRGWQRSGNRYAGYYASRHGTWPGVVERHGDTFSVFIKNPPRDVRLHPRFVCFHPDKEGQTTGWWRIHLHVQPTDKDPNSILYFVERLLAESHRLAGKR